jgi:hypothetical protein
MKKIPHTLESLLKKTVLNGTCKEFIGARNHLGYGKVGFHGKVMHAHRLAYKLFYGEIPKGKLVCHKCDNPSCVNPDHLFLGTHKDNTQDMIDKGRRRARARKDFCLRGHEMIGDNVYYNEKYKIRACVACRKLRHKIKSTKDHVATVLKQKPRQYQRVKQP